MDHFAKIGWQIAMDNRPNADEMKSMYQNPSYQPLLKVWCNSPSYLELLRNTDQLKPFQEFNPTFRNMMHDPEMMKLQVDQTKNGGLKGVQCGTNLEDLGELENLGDLDDLGGVGGLGNLLGIRKYEIDFSEFDDRPNNSISTANANTNINIVNTNTNANINIVNTNTNVNINIVNTNNTNANIITKSKINNNPGKTSIVDREIYKKQLAQLYDFGFHSEDLNLQTLKQTNGNVDEALEKLLKINAN